MKKMKRRGFTIVELVIVIAVIGVLSAVLIPTFVSLIHKANVASDTALARNLNTALAEDEFNGAPQNMEEVLIALDKEGFKLENLNPRADGNIFVWDSESNQILYLNKKGEVIFHSKNYKEKEDKGNLWLTIKKAADTETYKGYSYYLAGDNDSVTGNITLTENSSLDTGAKTLEGNVTVENLSASANISIRGKIEGEITVNSEKGTVSNYSVVNKVTITKTASESYHEYGYVSNTFTVEAGAAGGKVVLENGSYVNKLAVEAADVVTQEEQAYLNEVSGSEKGTLTATTGEGYTLKIGSYDELSRFRDKVNNGVSYAGATVELTADIDISSRAWTPIGANYRDGISASSPVFQGIFDGKGHTISGLNNTGFQLSSSFGGRNGSTPPDCTEFVFGLFGTVYDATIKNVKMSNVDIDLAYQPGGSVTKGYVLGDSVGAIVGCIFGTNDKGTTVTLCEVLGGTINGYDATGGIVGRIKGGKVVITDCSNAATITAIRRAAGIIGTDANYDNRTYSNLTNTGNITSLGQAADEPGKVNKAESGYNTQNYYLAAGIVAGIDNEGYELTDCANSGTVSAQRITEGDDVPAEGSPFVPYGNLAISHSQRYDDHENKWVSNSRKAA